MPGTVPNSWETALDKTVSLPSVTATPAEDKVDHVQIMAALSEVDSQERTILRREPGRLRRGKEVERGKRNKPGCRGLAGEWGLCSPRHRRRLDFTCYKGRGTEVFEPMDFFGVFKLKLYAIASLWAWGFISSTGLLTLKLQEEEDKDAIGHMPKNA